MPTVVKIWHKDNRFRVSSTPPAAGAGCLDSVCDCGASRSRGESCAVAAHGSALPPGDGLCHPFFMNHASEIRYSPSTRMDISCWRAWRMFVSDVVHHWPQISVGILKDWVGI